MNALEIFKNALLFSLLLILVYVLYKRMIRVLSKDRIQAKYPSIGNSIIMENGHGIIQVSLKLQSYLIVEVFTAEGNQVFVVNEGDYPIGDHKFSFELSKLSSGRYFYKVTSPHQESSQYFDID